jgi:hypothetical protein
MATTFGFVVDARDTRPAFNITYRRYCDVRSANVRAQADNAEEALRALTSHLGTDQYAVLSVVPLPRY